MIMALIISDDTLAQAQLSEQNLLIELACYLYEKKRLSMGRARGLAGLDHAAFLKELGARGIEQHYTRQDLDIDLKNLGIEL